MNPNPAQNHTARTLLQSSAYLITLLATIAITACSPAQSIQKLAQAATPVSSSAQMDDVATPLPGVEAPPMIAEQPLQGSPDGIPTVWIVPSLQSKQELATYIKSDVTQLDWVNPGLPNPVPPGTLVVIPPGYFARMDTSLPDIAAATGLPSDALLAANPDVSMDETVLAGTVLRVPQILFITEEIDWDEAAALLKISDEALLSANPALANDDDLDAGVVLVIPPEGYAE